jgi:MEDS: MEthanogen/methylotroph, DcmR Sensory domain
MRIQAPWKDLLVEPLARDHVVQLYRDERHMIEAVALFTAIALGKGEAVVLVGTPPHIQGVARRLEANGFSVEDVKDWGQLTVKDASETLSSFMVNDMPDAVLFKTMIGSVLQKAAAASRNGRVRVYGEMVNLLWRQNLPAASRLETLWNDVIQSHSISLFCAYHVDGHNGDRRHFPSDLRAAHSHLIPVEACG